MASETYKVWINRGDDGCLGKLIKVINWQKLWKLSVLIFHSVISEGNRGARLKKVGFRKKKCPDESKESGSLDNGEKFQKCIHLVKPG